MRGQRADVRAEPAAHLADVRVGGGLGRADRPVRLVGDDDPAAVPRIARERQRVVELPRALPRGVAGIRGQAIVCNTPGSPKGTIEQIDAVLDELPHALRLLHATPTDH